MCFISKVNFVYNETHTHTHTLIVQCTKYKFIFLFCLFMVNLWFFSVFYCSSLHTCFICSYKLCYFVYSPFFIIIIIIMKFIHLQNEYVPSFCSTMKGTQKEKLWNNSTFPQTILNEQQKQYNKKES